MLAFGLAAGLLRTLAQPLPPPPPGWWTNTVPVGWTNNVWWTNTPPASPNPPPPDWTTNGSGGWTNPAPRSPNYPPAWTNLFGGGRGNAPVPTNQVIWTNVPVAGSGGVHPRTVAPGQAAPAALPGDARALVTQFQQQRTQLLNSLNNASDSQRQEILGQMEALRQQLIGQLQQFRQMAIDQAHAMQGAFNNGGRNFGPGNAPQPTPGSGSHGGPPRN